MINDAGMSWGEYWSTPQNRTAHYVAACNRRQDRIERAREAARRGK